MEQGTITSDKEEELEDSEDAVFLLPDKLSDLLDPDEIKKGLEPSKKLRVRKTKEELLDLMIGDARRIAASKRGSAASIRFSEYDEIMPDFPSVNVPSIRRISDDRTLRDLEVNPAEILDTIWSHLISFPLFQAVETDVIPDHVYQNLLEAKKGLATISMNYSPKIDSLPEWLRNLGDWYNSTNSDTGWNALFSAHLPGIGGAELIQTEEKIFEMCLCIIIMYFRADNLYSGLGKKDLETFWDLSLQERQGAVLKIRPRNPADRFVFKYMNVAVEPPKKKKKKKKIVVEEEETFQPEEEEEEEEEPVVTPPVPAPVPIPIVPIIGLAPVISKQREIYFAYTLSSTINRLKKILLTRHLSDAIEHDLGHEELMREWRQRSKALLNRASSETLGIRNQTIIRLLNILKTLVNDFGG